MLSLSVTYFLGIYTHTQEVMSSAGWTSTNWFKVEQWTTAPVPSCRLGPHVSLAFWDFLEVAYYV